jgi:hypothetical protein
VVRFIPPVASTLAIAAFSSSSPSLLDGPACLEKSVILQHPQHTHTQTKANSCRTCYYHFATSNTHTMALYQMIPFNNTLIKKFLKWKQGDEEDNWRNKALDALVKKLKKTDPEGYRTLELVLSKKSEDTPCIALPRSQDGRLQVSHRKMLPQVMYCRIFRWPDLQSQHELKSLPSCQYPANRNNSKICVNPYHYARVDHSLYPPVVSPRTDSGFNNVSPPPQSPLSPYSQPQGSPANYFQQMPQLALMPMDGVEDAHQSSLNYSGQQQEPWCRIHYAELNHKIGEPFKSSSPQVFVDGFTDPSIHNRRFSLGVISNINRNSTIEMTRRAIRKGICLENQDDQIFVINLSEASIFFQSKNCNLENQLNKNAVVKIEPNQRQKIFDQKIFEGVVQEARNTTEGNAYERLFHLIEHCSIKMSFVKGWGSIYQRQDVTSTPCWIEICLLKPYALLDTYLQETRPIHYNITSTS